MKTMWDHLYTKNGWAAKRIARHLLTLNSGDRIPRVDDFVQELSLGRGTVQAALRLLEETGAVVLEPRGHLGTFLKRKDARLLWNIAGIGHMVGVMPLPYSRKYEGLATGLMEAFQALGVPFNMAYMRGASHRIETLIHERNDFAVVSRMAGEWAVDRYKNLRIVKGLGEGSYVSGHRIYFANREETRIRPGMRVGIDPHSTDQTLLSRCECEGLTVDWVEVNYMQIFDMLMEGEIDAAVWSRDEFRASGRLGKGELQSLRARELASRTGEAVLIAGARAGEWSTIFDRLDGGKVREIQRRVEEGRMFPRY